MSDIILSMQSGEPVASSRQIAENFEKNHNHVLRDIDSLKKMCPILDRCSLKPQRRTATEGNRGLT